MRGLLSPLQQFCFVIALLLGTTLSAQDSISVTVNPSQTGIKIPDDFTGLGFEKNSFNRNFFSPSKDTLVNLFKTLGVKVIRVGGDSVDKDSLELQTTGSSYTIAQIDSFYQFAQKVNCKVISGLNLANFNPSAVAAEARYIMQNYAANVSGFEIGNEPDLYGFNGYRDGSYGVSDYETEYLQYLDSIQHYSPMATLIGPATFFSVSGFTEPFCKDMSGKFSTLTHHYYVGPANAGSTSEQIDNLLAASSISGVTAEIDSLVPCSSASGAKVRIGETNSFYNGGQWSVSNSFASALWMLDYMYSAAEHGCGGLNVHGGLSGPYTVIAYDSIYHARDIYYGILAFQAGNKGNIIPAQTTGDSINLTVHSIKDSAQHVYVTLINKNLTTNAIVTLSTGSADYNSGSFITMAAPSIGDTTTVSLGGQIMQADGTIGSYNWQPLTVANNKTIITVPAASAAIIHLVPDTTASAIKPVAPANTFMQVYPNPAHESLTVSTTILEGSIKFTDLNGQELPSLPITASGSSQGSLTFQVSTSGLKPGMYFVQLYDKQGLREEKRFVIQ